MSPFTGWRTALRIAIRQTRREKGRSILVACMIGLPVFGLSAAAVNYDMFSLTAAEKADRLLGSADASVHWDFDRPVTQTPEGDLSDLPDDAKPASHTTAQLAAVLPAGSRVASRQRGEVALKTPDGLGRFPAEALDLTDPLFRGLAKLTTGRTPAAVGEVALTDQARQRLHTLIGGTVRLANGAGEFRVVGIAEFPDDLHARVVFGAAQFPPKARWVEPQSMEWLVDAPAAAGWTDGHSVDPTALQRLNRLGMTVTPRTVIENQESPDEGSGDDLSFGGLLIGLCVLEVVLLAGPAFAVGVRRRQRELALVAANGGTPAHLRRIVLADGVVLGVIGGAAGTVLGIVAAFAVRPLVEVHLIEARAGGYRIFPSALAGIAALAVLTGVLAALVPAVTASRQDVVSALAGRRGIIRSRRRWVALGLLMICVGAATAGYGAYDASRSTANTILAGLVIGELGIVLCTPKLVGLISRMGPVLPVALRIALRNAARNRAAAAPAISAVMAAVAGSVAIGVFLASQAAQQQSSQYRSMPVGAASVHFGFDANGGDTALAGQEAALRSALRTTLPVSEVVAVRRVACSRGSDESRSCELRLPIPKERRCPYWGREWSLSRGEARTANADARCARPAESAAQFRQSVDDGTALAALTGASGDDLAAGVRTLKAGGAVVTDDRFVTDGTAEVAAGPDPESSGTDSSAGQPIAPSFRVPAYVLRTSQVRLEAVLSPQAVHRAGMDSRLTGVLTVPTRVPTTAEREAAQAAVANVLPDAYLDVSGGTSFDLDSRLLVLAGLAGLVTLAAAGMATGLAAVDGRAELSTLAAVGASPRVRRRLALSHSGVIAGLGTLLGVAAGLGAAGAVLFALNQKFAQNWPIEAPLPLTVPWPVLAVVLAVPVVAMLGAGAFTRSRLPVERRIG